ncbi:hypothetical protein LX32DRAFT_232625 [Colletotrichum zoysiae]|uniref:Uncharacterized protein n=1 Tax=Colletotrichum zoysiae TaxID=1216348 RepID=A0AAD9H3N6_9PEZI|nr:hypothetical protein LX32DRAFT_232625 [Colletotrichum zoysiae]
MVCCGMGSSICKRGCASTRRQRDARVVRYVLCPVRFTGVAVSVNRSRLRTIPTYLPSLLQEVSKPTGVCSSDEQRGRKEISEEKLKIKDKIKKTKPKTKKMKQRNAKGNKQSAEGKKDQNRNIRSLEVSHRRRWTSMRAASRRIRRRPPPCPKPQVSRAPALGPALETGPTVNLSLTSTSSRSVCLSVCLSGCCWCCVGVGVAFKPTVTAVVWQVGLTY